MMSTLRIGITSNVEFAVDQHDNLSIERRDNWGTGPKHEVVIGFLTPRLIDQMIENLNRLRTFAK